MFGSVLRSHARVTWAQFPEAGINADIANIIKRKENIILLILMRGNKQSRCRNIVDISISLSLKHKVFFVMDIENLKARRMPKVK